MGPRMKNQKLGSVLARTKDFAKGKRLEPQVKRFIKVSKLGDVASKLVQLKRRHRGARGHEGSGQSPGR